MKFVIQPICPWNQGSEGKVWDLRREKEESWGKEGNFDRLSEHKSFTIDQVHLDYLRSCQNAISRSHVFSEVREKSRKSQGK